MKFTNLMRVSLKFDGFSSLNRSDQVYLIKILFLDNYILILYYYIPFIIIVFNYSNCI